MELSDSLFVLWLMYSSIIRISDTSNGLPEAT
jgi:hypothetical protein